MAGLHLHGVTRRALSEQIKADLRVREPGHAWATTVSVRKPNERPVSAPDFVKREVRRFRPKAHGKSHKGNGLMVGAEGFEPPTLCSQSRCATRLRYAPTFSDCISEQLGTYTVEPLAFTVG